MVNETNAVLIGVMYTYLLSITGRDYAGVKGMGFGAFAWTAVYGLSTRFNITDRSHKPLSHLLAFIDHLINGYSCGLLVAKLGDDSLFPDTGKADDKEKLPLVNLKQEKTKKAYPVMSNNI